VDGSPLCFILKSCKVKKKGKREKRKKKRKEKEFYICVKMIGRILNNYLSMHDFFSHWIKE
jgi:hypothetical protein